MDDFNTIKPLFVVPFDDEQKEERKLDAFLCLLNRSGLSALLAERQEGPLGGRPCLDSCSMLATIIFAFADGSMTVRRIEKACRFDIRYAYLMSWKKPRKTAIADFINDVISRHRDLIFQRLTSLMLEEMGINALEDVFIDGSKFEANANKYRFVWKPAHRIRKLMARVDAFLSGCNVTVMRDECPTDSLYVARAVSELERRVRDAGIDPAAVTTGRGVRNPKTVTDYLTCAGYLSKVTEYEEQIARCGSGRNSYYKTDTDATAMCLKEDYYSGKGSNMHAAYNVQLAVSQGIIVGYHVSQDRADSRTFPVFVEKMHDSWGKYPKNICADAGYGSIANYRYVHEKGIGNYLKFPSWEGEVSGSRPSLLSACSDGSIICLGGKKAVPADGHETHPKHSGTCFMVVRGCRGCIYRKYCMKSLKKRHPNERIIETSLEWLACKAEAKSNLLSPKGIELRVNRSIQVEGTFGILKQDIGYERFRRRGIGNVETEMMLTCLGANIRKYLRFVETGKVPTFWKAPASLSPELPRRISCAVRRGGKSTANLRKQPNQIAKRSK